MILLRQLLRQLGPLLQEPVALTDSQLDVPVLRSVIHDPLDTGLEAAGDLVLGVALTDAPAVRAAATRLAPAAAVVLRASVADAGVLGECAAHGIVLLTVSAEVPWSHLAAVLRSQLADGSLHGHLPDADSDLFALANAIAAVVGAPITIEDPQFQVLAFSGHQDHVDAARVATIMGRQAPEAMVARMRERGIFQRLHASAEPIFVAGRAPDILPRVVMAVRAGTEVLGSIWVASTGELEPDGNAALVRAASDVALHLLRRQVQADTQRRLHIDLVTRLLGGDVVAARTANWPIHPASSQHVVAVRLAGLVADTEGLWALTRVADGLEMHLRASVQRAAAAVVDNTVYVVVATRGEPCVGSAVVRQLLSEYADRAVSPHHPPLLVGQGRGASGVTGLPASRRSADQALSVLLRDARERSRVVHADDVDARALVLKMTAVVAEDPELGSTGVRRLRDIDARTGSQHEATLRAFLACHGAADLMADMLHLHPNSVRHRLRRLRETGALDLDSADARFAAYVHLQTPASEVERPR